MCGTNDLQVTAVDLCYSEKQDEEEDGQEDNKNSNNSRRNNSSVEKVWTETQQMMDQREQLVRIMTHVCSRQLSGAYRTLARYSQGCWRGCSAEESLEGRRGVSHPYYVHLRTAPSPPPSSPPPSASHHSTCSTYSSSSGQPQMPSSSSSSFCKACTSCGCSGDLASVTAASAASGSLVSRHTPPASHSSLQQEEEHAPSSSPSSATSLSCRWCGACCRHGRWRWGRSCQCSSARFHPNCCRRCPSSTLMLGMGGGGGGGTWPVSTPSCSPPQHPVVTASSSSPTPRHTTHSHRYPVPPCPTTTATTTVCNRATKSQPPPSASPSYTPAGALTSRRATLPPPSLARTASPKSRGGAPAHPSLLTILLLLVVTLARFTDGCSSRSTPKPRPASPTMRPNITFQTYACPPAYAAWYCLNGATCFTVKIGESILYNCECADGYMGQRCEFKDLDGSYIPAREKVLLETASIAGGATVACVLVFIVLFAVYIFMQKDKDKRCRDLDDGRDNDRQPFSGYQNPRPEVFRTISNPYARTLDELSHVEVESAGHGGNTGTGGRIGSGSTAGAVGGGNPVDSNPHHNGKQQQQQQQTTSAPTAL